MAEMDKYLAKNEFSKLTTANPTLSRWQITITAHTLSKKPLTFCFHRLLLRIVHVHIGFESADQV